MSNELVGEHTPGQWEYVDTLSSCWVNSGTRQILSYRHSPDKENRANARLIAAAPKLLHALQWMVTEQEREGFGDELPDIKNARIAIKEALGL